jgi:hypothetical protein
MWMNASTESVTSPLGVQTGLERKQRSGVDADKLEPGTVRAIGGGGHAVPFEDYLHGGTLDLDRFDAQLAKFA